MFARLLLLALLVAPAALAQAPPSVPGRYRLRICEGSCNAGVPWAEGTLVLLAMPMRDAAGAVRTTPGGEPVNGCFLFTTLRRHGLLGGPRAGPALWRGERLGGVWVDLDPEGVDASYVLVLRVAPGGLAGKGLSSYASAPRPPPLPPDPVVAERQGDADARMCDAWALESAHGPACTRLSACR
ncbi:hypothetical protein [Fulvimonas yonginensis]|uniref:DUF2147 domain-containing protein n=1 Tax=Fulvimonas yonginensis TaxID=1495200 RepID=A0ABU8JE34_9GAMM